MFYPGPRSPGGKSLWDLIQRFRAEKTRLKLDLQPSYQNHREKSVAESLHYHERNLVEEMEHLETGFGLATGTLRKGENLSLCLTPGCNRFYSWNEDGSEDEYECPLHRKAGETEVEAPPPPESTSAERHRYQMEVRDLLHRKKVRQQLAQLRAEAAAL